MSTGGATCAVVGLADGTLGIVTDRDLRTRVLAAGLGGDAPASAAMSAPAYTCRPDRCSEATSCSRCWTAASAFYPVGMSATGNVLGVIEDVDLVAAYSRTSFFLRQRIGSARTIEQLVAAGRELVPTVIAMHDARVAATNIMAVYSVVVDALTRRALELEVGAAQQPVGSFAWLALGSQARREMVPSSDIDSAVVWFGDADEAALRPRLESARRQGGRRSSRRAGWDPTRTGRARPTPRSCDR